MSKDQSAVPEDPNAPYEVPEARQKSARKWFQQAAKLVEQRNYDYAIKSFTEGLTLDPEAVEEGYIPLRGCAMARWQTGGKKPSMMEAMKYPTSSKDPIKGLVNSAWRFGHDPTNADHAEGIMKNANKAHCEKAMMWVGPIYGECIQNEKKPTPKKFTLLKDSYEELGDRLQARGNVLEAAQAYEMGLDALTYQKAVEPQNRTLDNIIRDLSTKLTILKGKYETAGNFRESIQDSDQQAKLHDEDRLVQSTERLKELIGGAKAEMDANPEVEAKVINYVDLLCREENEVLEKEAITVLVERFKGTDNYRFKQRADDIAIKQMGREIREARKAQNKDRERELAVRRLKFELAVFKERISRYPTDLRLKFEYARRLFQARRFDDAIPLFQQARAEPKVRNACALHLGRCFFEKGLPAQAVDVLGEAIEAYELTGDDTAKELNYWLGRAQEAGGKVDEARRTYGKLMQIDYNYRDVRSRMDQSEG